MSKCIRVVNSGFVANFEVIREDGHTLSMSSSNNSLIHWDTEANGGACITDYGPVFGADRYLQIVADFLGKRISQLAPTTQELVEA